MDKQDIEEMAFEFMTSHEVVFGKTNVTGRECAATAITSDDIVALIEKSYAAGRASVGVGQ